MMGNSHSRHSNKIYVRRMFGRSVPYSAVYYTVWEKFS